MLKKMQRGYTVIELMITMVFISGLVAVLFVQYQKLQATKKSDTESQHVMNINNSVKSLYGTARSYQTLTNTVLINAKQIPDDMQVAGAVINNVWGGTVVIAPDAGANNLRYTITYTGIPRLECNKMATSVGVNFERMDINGNNIYDRSANGGNVDLDPAAISGQCQEGSANTIIFTAR